MAAEALAPFISRDPARRQQQLDQHRKNLVKLLYDNPDLVRPATVFFSRGIGSDELQRLAEGQDLEVIDVHVKAPQGTQGVIMSIMFGMADLLATDGDLDSRLTFAIAAEQECFAKRAKFVPPEEAQEWEALATQPFLAYSARVFGSISSLDALQRIPDVTSVMLNVPEDVISDYEGRKSRKEPHPYLMPGFHC
jgi:hypothetical protein